MQKSKHTRAPSNTSARSCQGEGPPQPGPPVLQAARQRLTIFAPNLSPKTRKSESPPVLGSLIAVEQADARIQGPGFDSDHPKVGYKRVKASLQKSKSKREATGFCSSS